MRHRLLAAVGLLAVTSFTPAAEPALEQIRKDLFYLAGEECEGRGIETDGIRKAGDYIAATFREAGLKPAIADAIAAGTRPAGMTEEEAIVYDFVSELLATGQVSDAGFARVKAAFGERGVVDLVGAVGYYSLVSMVLNVARVPLPAGVDPPLK